MTYSLINTRTGEVIREMDRLPPARTAVWRYQDRQRAKGCKRECKTGYKTYRPLRKRTSKQARPGEAVVGVGLAVVVGCVLIVMRGVV